MNINFNKSNGLVPVIIQHVETSQVLMLCYMNEEAFVKTQQEQKVTFLAVLKTDYGLRANKVDISYSPKIYR